MESFRCREPSGRAEWEDPVQGEFSGASTQDDSGRFDPRIKLAGNFVGRNVAGKRYLMAVSSGGFKTRKRRRPENRNKLSTGSARSSA